jgi:hypothetical protein
MRLQSIRFKCRGRSTLVGGSVEGPAILSRDPSLTKQKASVFNKLPRLSGKTRFLAGAVRCSVMLEELTSLKIAEK